MWALKTISFAGVYLLLCIGSLYNPIIGVVNYMLVYQIDPSGTWWGIPLANTGVRFSFVAASFLIAGMMLSGRKVPTIRPFLDPWEIGAITLVVLAFLSVLIGMEYTAESAARLDKFWKMMLFVLLMGRLVSTRRNLHIVLWTIVIGTLYLGREAFLAPSDRFAQGRLNFVGGADFRYSSGVAAHLAAMLPLVGAVALICRRWYLKLLVLGTGALAFNALVLCRTRSAFIGLIVGGLAAAVTAPRRRRVRVYLLIAICLPVAIRLTDAGFWNRMATLVDPTAAERDEAISTRIDIWRAGLRMINDHPFGVGAGNFERTSRFYFRERRAAHNTIINCIAELGVQSGLVFALMLFGSFRKVYISSKLAELTDKPVETRFLAYGIMIAMVTYLVAGFFTERFYAESFWWTLTLPLCLERVVLREVRERQPWPSMEPALAEPVVPLLGFGRPAAAG
ncbi:MAG: hypothetical protein C4547_15275 [Phycisphaerales bacterium]|nr:MAG: hypothetical protein C4547_15275 [Phycisphaerales bacterium]